MSAFSRNKGARAERASSRPVRGLALARHRPGDTAFLDRGLVQQGD